MSRLRELTSEVCERENCRLYDLEIVGEGSGRILRVYVESQNSSNFVSINDCANVSNGLSLILDVEDLIPGDAYNLEVSSPGLNRHLKEPWHFEKVIGETVRAKLKGPLVEVMDSFVALESSGDVESPAKLEPPMSWQKRRQVESQLLRIENECLVLVADKMEVKIPISAVEKANVVANLELAQKPKKLNEKKKSKKSKKNKKKR